jgi:hypothetical protein
MERSIHELHINRTWTWILIGAVAALIIAIWLPNRGTARAAVPAYIFPEDNPDYVPPAFDYNTKPSPFPDQPRHSSQ